MGDPNSPGTATQDVAGLVARSRRAVVTVVPEDAAGRPMTQGAGFFIAPGKVVAAREVLEGARAVRVLLWNGGVHAVAGTLAEDAAAGLALLGIEGPAQGSPQGLPLATLGPREGERVTILGSALVPEKSVAEGEILSVREVPALGTVLRLSATVPPGSSGAPVLRQDGEVVAVALTRTTGGLKVSYAVPVGRVRGLQNAETTPLGRAVAPAVAGRALAALRVQFEEDPAAAAEQWKALAAEVPGDPLAWTVLAECLVEDGRWDEAIEAARRALALDADEARAHAAVGEALQGLERLPEALEAYRSALRVRPEDPALLLRLGVTLHALGRREEAADAYRQALRLRPGDAQTHKNLGVACYQMGRGEESVAALREAVRLRPDFARAHNDLGLALFSLRRLPEAIEACKQAIRIRPDFARAHNNLGVAYYRSGRIREALEAYDQAIRLRSGFAAAHANRGAALAKAGRYQEAVEADRRAIGIAPGDTDAYANLGVVYEKLGRVREAIDAFGEALRIDPSNPRAHHYLGVAHCQAGDKAAALREYETLKGIDAARAGRLFELIYR